MSVPPCAIPDARQHAKLAHVRGSRGGARGYQGLRQGRRGLHQGHQARRAARVAHGRKLTETRPLPRSVGVRFTHCPAPQRSSSESAAWPDVCKRPLWFVVPPLVLSLLARGRAGLARVHALLTLGYCRFLFANRSGAVGATRAQAFRIPATHAAATREEAAAAQQVSRVARARGTPALRSTLRRSSGGLGHSGGWHARRQRRGRCDSCRGSEPLHHRPHALASRKRQPRRAAY